MVVLELDGIMCESHIYINGTKVGGCHFGYLSFEVDITDYVIKGANLLAIHAIVYHDSSRWYSGGGLYRNVRLVTKPKEYIKYNGAWIRQIYADSKSALFDITANVVGKAGFTAKITDPKGNITEISTSDDKLSYFIENPMLWDVNEPNLYTAEITIDSGDSIKVRFGARNTKFTKDGFFLNGRYLKMHGVCMHHDLGSLGAAVNVSALKRQLKILKGMGVNSIRTSHNPPTPELLDLCDEYGIVVMDEFFDEWANDQDFSLYYYLKYVNNQEA
jgi:beta-galactosidase